MHINDDQDWSDRRNDFSYSAFQRHLTNHQQNSPQNSNFTIKFLQCILTSIIGHQVIYALEKRQSKATLVSGLKANIRSTLRPTQFTAITFGLKIALDCFSHFQSEYTKGGIAGVIGYAINRPLDQVQAARRTIHLNQAKSISRIEGIRVVLRHDGFKGFYKHENILAPTSSALHRSIYFGLYHRLLAGFGQRQKVIDYLIAPFLASLGASSSTFLIDKLRSAYVHVHMLRDTSIVKRSKKQLMESVSPTREVFAMLGSGKIAISKGDIAAVSVSVAKNSLLLSFYAIGQSFLEEARRNDLLVF